MNWIGTILASFFGAVLSALGMGGGGILLIFLTIYAGIQQQTAQGINLVFYIPVAAVALFIHHKNKLICWRLVWPAVVIGAAGVWIGTRMAFYLEADVLSKLFGGMLLIIGLRELFAKPPKDKDETSNMQTEQ